MPGEETKFQPAGMQTQGLYTPVVGSHVQYTPFPMANYGPMLQAIEQAGNMIQNSALNPEVRARMQLSQAGSAAGQQMIKNLMSTSEGQWRLGMLGGVQGGQFNLAPGITASQWARAQMGQENQLPEGPQNNPNTISQGNETTPSPPPANVPGAPQIPQAPQQPAAPETPAPAQPQQPSNQQPNIGPQNAPARPTTMTSPFSTNGPVPGAPQVNPNLSASTDNTFLTQRLMQQRQIEEQAAKQNLIQWQNQQATPPASVQEARDWAAAHDTEMANARVVYLPHGGPVGANGQKEPAYAFIPKRGGPPNVVPVSQMVKSGFGAQVLANNTSEALMASDQQHQMNSQQSGAQYQPQNFQQPGAQLSDAELQQRLAQATNVQATGGPGPTAMTAEATPVNRMDAVQQITGVGPEQFKQMHANYRPGEIPMDPGRGDPPAGRFGNFQWYFSDNGKGPAYTVKPGNTPLLEDRLYEGGTGWEPFTPPENVQKINLLRLDPRLSPAQVQAMTPEDVQGRLEQAYYLNEILPKTTQFSPQAKEQLDHEANVVLYGNRIQNAIKGEDPAKYNKAAQDANNWARTGTALSNQPRGISDFFNNVGAFFSGMMAGKPESSRLTFAQNQYQNLENEIAKEHPNQSPDLLIGGFRSGSKSFPSDFNNFLNQHKLQFQRDVTAALNNNERIPGSYVDMASDMRSGRPWYDVADNYGPGSQQRPGQAQVGEAQYHAGPAQSPGSRPAATPSATPTGTPVPGADQSHPIDIKSATQLQGIHGAFVRDSTGAVRWKQ
jgi:hypothetical protein